MDYFFLGNAMLFLGAFALQFGLFNSGSSSGSGTEPTTTEPDLYQPDLYSQEVLGTTGDDIVDSTSPLAEAFFLGDGNDTLDATFMNDYAEGGAGNDSLRMRPGDDIALGGTGNDSIDGGLGDDTLYGDDGDDWMTGNKGDDVLYGGAGQDTLLGSGGNDLLDGGDGNDVLNGNNESAPGASDDGIDTLLGGEGDDSLLLGAGDVGTGGAGADSFYLYDPQDSGTTAEITDYNPDEDMVGVVYTPANDPNSGDPIVPTVSVAANAEGTAGIVSLDGIEVARIIGGQGLGVADIALIPDA